MAFEENLRRLESIVDQLDGSDLELEAALRLFEEGIALIRQATDELAVAETRVKRLIEEADGTITTRPLDG